MFTRIGSILCVLATTLLSGYVPQQAGVPASSVDSLQRSSCERGESCILTRDWTRPWVADIQNRPVRHLESEEKNSGSVNSAYSLDRLDRHASQQPTLDVREPTLAEKTLALLYPYHELG